MTIEGFWRFTLSDEAIAAGIELPSALVVLHGGHIRGMETAPTVSGHYRVNGTTLTCFLRSLISWSNLSRPICQFVGELHADMILLRGSCDDHPNVRFDAKLARPKVGASTNAEDCR